MVREEFPKSPQTALVFEIETNFKSPTHLSPKEKDNYYKQRNKMTKVLHDPKKQIH